MIKEIIILFAIKNEADSLLNHSEIKFKKEKGFHSGVHNGYLIKVYIIGIGKSNVVKWLNAFKIIENECLLIKAGTCAVLNDDIELLQAIVPSYLGYNDSKIDIDFDKIPDAMVKKIKKYIHKDGLVTVDTPLTDRAEADKLLKKNYHFADMETYFVPEKLTGYPFLAVAVGSDRGDKNSTSEFYANLPKVSECLKNTLIEIIKA